MIFKKFIAPVISLLFMIHIAGCTPAESELQPLNVSLLSFSTGPNVFKDTVPSYSPKYDSQEPSKPASSIDFSFQEQNIQLYYDETLSTDLNVYMSKDRSITCWYDKHTNALRLLSSEIWNDLDCSKMDQSEYESWIKKQVSAYYPEHWEQYQLTVKTTLLPNNNENDPLHVEPSFVPIDNADFTVDSYAFTYTRHIDNFPTTDLIHVCFWPSQNFAIIEFSAHCLDETTSLDITQERILQNIDRFIPESINTEEYAYRSHSSATPVLTYQHGKLYCTCSVTIVTLSALQASDPINSTAELIIPLP